MHRSERCDYLFNSLFARLLFCYICLDDDGSSPFGVDHALRFLDPLEVVVYQCDFGAVPCENYGSGSTVTNFA